MASRVQSSIVCVDEQNFSTASSGITLSITTEGNLHVLGTHTKKGHGFKDVNVFPPKIIPGLKNIKAIACGYSHTCCLDEDGKVYMFGSNKNGELGVGKKKPILDCTHEPQKMDLPSIRQISCGIHHTVCLSEQGDVYSFGRCSYNLCDYPKKIESLKNVDFIECGGNFTICRTVKGDIYSWGGNKYGQLGNGTYNGESSPYHCYKWPKDIVDIKCGDSHTLVLTSSQEVYSCGNNNQFQIGRTTGGYTYSPILRKVDALSEILRIECGEYHSMCIDANYDLYVFGSNTYGQLGLGDSSYAQEITKHTLLSNIIDISKGGNHSFIKTSNNEIYAFGNNDNSQLGIKTEDEIQLIPIRVFEDNEDIWVSNTNKPKPKSARSILPRPSNEEDNSPPKKKQKTE